MTKYLGERAVLSWNDNLVLRICFMHGLHPHKTSFVHWVINNLRQEKPIKVVNGLLTTPTYMPDLIYALITLLEAGATGLYHYSGSEYINRYHFARRIAQIFSLDESLIQRMNLKELYSKWAAKRPIHSGLRSDKIYQEFHIPSSDLDEGLNSLRKEMSQHSSESEEALDDVTVTGN